MYIHEDDKFDKKYNELLLNLVDIFQFLFIYINLLKLSGIKNIINLINKDYLEVFFIIMKNNLFL